MKRLRKQIEMRPPKSPAWAGEPNARELELERKIARLEARFKGRTWEELPEAIAIEYGRLHCELLIESQKRSGFELIKITRNAAGDGATYDMRAFRRVVKAVEMLTKAGVPQANAVARAIEDERWRQQQEQEREPETEKRAGFFGKIKDIFRTS